MSLHAPLIFEPRFQAYVWGGRNLERVLGRTIPEGRVAESWEVSAHPAAPTIVAAGPLAGRTLPDLIQDHGPALVGDRGRWAVERGTFPLLVKLLDANQPLSVQVHPADDYAMEHEGGELGKTEMWYVLHAEEGAEIVYGLRSGTTRATFREALAGGRVGDCLHRLPVQAGDAILIEAGTVHAILEGIVLAEVQQSSNVTYRLYDWDRVGTDGKPRELHVDRAMDVIDFGRWEPGPRRPVPVSDQGGVRREVISACDKFVVERVSLAAGARFAGTLDGETFEIWGCLDGQLSLHAPDGSADLEAVAFALLPARAGAFEVQAREAAVALRVFLPPVPTTLTPGG